MSRHKALGVAAAALLAAVLALGVYGPSLIVSWVLDAHLQRNTVGSRHLDLPAGDHPEVWLVVGSDRRTRPGVVGRRADTLLLVAPRGERGANVAALPRDIQVDAGSSGSQRLGGLLDYGAPELVRAVRSEFGVPVHHYVEIEMAAVAPVVDALGGVRMNLRYAARDRQSGLALSAGHAVIDGRAALAFVRSRQYEEYRAGRWVPVSADDRGRLERQLRLADLVRQAVADGPGTSLRLARQAGVNRHVSIDQRSTAGDLAELVTATRARSWNILVLPTRRLVALRDSISPFPPAHLGTGGAVAPTTDPAAWLSTVLELEDNA